MFGLSAVCPLRYGCLPGVVRFFATEQQARSPWAGSRTSEVRRQASAIGIALQKAAVFVVSARYAAPLPPRCHVAIFPIAFFRRKQLIHIVLQTNCRFADPRKGGNFWQSVGSALPPQSPSQSANSVAQSATFRVRGWLAD